MIYPCVCGTKHRNKKYADQHTQKILNRINKRKSREGVQHQ